MSSSRSASCCTFTFSDGRRCRTPRQSGHPLFCSDHARRHDRINTAGQLGREFDHFFSGRYLSACDLNSALGRLFAATVRGHVPAKTARTLAYLAQVMVQCIHLTENEYANSFSSDAWRKAVRSSVNSNSGYLSPSPVQAGLQPSPSCPPSARPVAPPQNVPAPLRTPQPIVPTNAAGPRPPAFVEAGLQFTLSPEGPGHVPAPVSAPLRHAPSQPATAWSGVGQARPATPSSSGTASAAMDPSSTIGSAATPALSDSPDAAAAFRPAQSSSSLKSQLKQLLVSERVPNSAPPSQPVKPAASPARKQQSARTATGPSGLPLLAELPLPGSQKPSVSSSSVTLAESTLTPPHRSC